MNFQKRDNRYNFYIVEPGSCKICAAKYYCLLYNKKICTYNVSFCKEELYIDDDSGWWYFDASGYVQISKVLIRIEFEKYLLLKENIR